MANARGPRLDETAYRFTPVANCNMCGAPADDASIVGRRLNRNQGLRPSSRSGVATTVVRCRQCGLVFADPLPIPDELARHYGTPPENYWRSQYFEDRDTYFAAEIERFRGLWHGAGTPVALDIGAGLGKAMASLTRQGFDTYGVEPSEPFRARALENLGVPDERLQLATVEAADFRPAGFDFVTFGAVLEHLADPASAIDRAMLWLRPGGLVHVEVPSATWLMSRALNTLYRLQGLDYCTNLSPMHVPYHLYEFTLTAFEAHAARRTHRVVGYRRHVGDAFVPPPLSALASWLMRATRTGMQLEVWLGKDVT